MKKILWVSENSFHDRPWFDLLQENGYELDFARNTDEAIKKIRAVKYEAITTNVFVPTGISENEFEEAYKSGIGIKQFVNVTLKLVDLTRQEPLNAHTPIFILETDMPGFSDFQKEYVAKGATAYFDKGNCLPSDFLSKVSRYLTD